MDANDPRQAEIFFEVHSNLPREGPGHRDGMLQALELVGPLGQTPRVLDIGCGPGLQTVELAEALRGAQITAVDAHAPYLEVLQRTARERGVHDRITAQTGDMNQLDFPAGSFDLLWSEGAAYIAGFQRALELWRPLLTERGRVALSEPVFLRDAVPPDVARFWQAYPAMTTLEGCGERVRAAGYTLRGGFVLSERAWWEHYYDPMSARLTRLREKYEDDGPALGVLAACAEEIDLYRHHADCYGYAFFVASPA